MAALQMNSIISEVIIDQQRQAAVIKCVGALCEEQWVTFSARASPSFRWQHFISAQTKRINRSSSFQCFAIRRESDQVSASWHHVHPCVAVHRPLVRHVVPNQELKGKQCILYIRAASALLRSQTHAPLNQWRRWMKAIVFAAERSHQQGTTCNRRKSNGVREVWDNRVKTEASWF